MYTLLYDVHTIMFHCIIHPISILLLRGYHDNSKKNVDILTRSVYLYDHHGDCSMCIDRVKARVSRLIVSNNQNVKLLLC